MKSKWTFNNITIKNIKTDMKKEAEQTRAMSIKGVCEIFGCTRPTYYQKYAGKLSPIPNVQGRILFRESEVLELKRKEDHPDILIVK
ncbi:MAG: putative DNA-binding transcriptional regulator AlpA [Flavobacteriales bacterium]